MEIVSKFGIEFDQEGLARLEAVAEKIGAALKLHGAKIEDGEPFRFHLTREGRGLTPTFHLEGEINTNKDLARIESAVLEMTRIAQAVQP